MTVHYSFMHHADCNEFPQWLILSKLALVDSSGYRLEMFCPKHKASWTCILLRNGK